MPLKEVLRNKAYIRRVVREIASLKVGRQARIMEVCGTHTYAFFRFGLRSLLSRYVDFISGPGCPVCITAHSYIDKALYLAKDRSNLIATFGDLLRVRGSRSSLEEARAKGAHVQMVYSPRDALVLARKHKKKKVIFLGVGFETTAPLIAAAVKEAKRLKVDNFFVLPGNRLIPPAMDLLCQDTEITIDGFLCPGHVSAVIGTASYANIVKKYHKGCVVAGFEPMDIAVSLYILLCQVKNKRPALANTYTRVVRPEGNQQALTVMRDVFTAKDALWRGLGVMRRSGLFFRKKYASFDAGQFIDAVFSEKAITKGCLCAEIIKGKSKPPSCGKFARACSPRNPLGPCMVSFEGACRIYYQYRRESDTITPA